VTSVIIFLESGHQNVFLLYRKLRDDSTVTLIALYEAWNKPEKAKQWRQKLLETEANTE
jgi:hypothetical protein